MKSIKTILVLLVIGVIGWFVFSKKEPKSLETEDLILNQNSNDRQFGEVTAVTFTGTFEDYGTGCFADGECYAIVDGKHITTILGWTKGPVGQFVDPDIDFGTSVEVYALPTLNGKYTLYGSNEYYIKEVK